jgi:hypothetical protein
MKPAPCCEGPTGTPGAAEIHFQKGCTKRPIQALEPHQTLSWCYQMLLACAFSNDHRQIESCNHWISRLLRTTSIYQHLPASTSTGVLVKEAANQMHGSFPATLVVDAAVSSGLMVMAHGKSTKDRWSNTTIASMRASWNQKIPELENVFVIFTFMDARMSACVHVYVCAFCLSITTSPYMHVCTHVFQTGTSAMVPL